MVDKSIFKAYDVRGTYPNQINEEVAYQIGRAFVEHIKVKEVAVGYDMRLSAGEIFKGLTEGIMDAGAKVYNLGRIGSEMLYYALGYKNIESGIMITASHNPPQYNGMKFVGPNVTGIGSNNGLNEIGSLATSKTYERTNLPQNMENLDVFAEYKIKLRELVNFSDIKPLKVVVDAGNGMGGILFDHFFGDIGLDITRLYFEPDGRFPNHEANPIKEENTVELRAKVKELGADLGIALDGDGDRVFFIDENGEYSSGYFLVAVLAKEILKKYPGASIVHENRLEWAIIDTVNENGGIPVRSKPGYVFIKAMMKDLDSPFGGENSSHFFYKDLYSADSSMLTIAILLQILSQQNVSLSKLLSGYKSKYFVCNETNFKVENPDEVFEKIKEQYSNQNVELDFTDGVSCRDNRNWRFNVRKSNTEPVVRVNVEAKTQELVDSKLQELELLIGGEKE